METAANDKDPGNIGEDFGPDLKAAVENLWQDPAYKEAFGRRNEIQLTDSVA